MYTNGTRLVNISGKFLLHLCSHVGSFYFFPESLYLSFNKLQLLEIHDEVSKLRARSLLKSITGHHFKDEDRFKCCQE